MSFLAGLLCATVGLPCAEPTVADVQLAYEQAARMPQAKHLTGLKVVGVDCEPSINAYVCQVVFKIDGEADDRDYLELDRP